MSKKLQFESDCITYIYIYIIFSTHIDLRCMSNRPPRWWQRGREYPLNIFELCIIDIMGDSLLSDLQVWKSPRKIQIVSDLPSTGGTGDKDLLSKRKLPPSSATRILQDESLLPQFGLQSQQLRTHRNCLVCLGVPWIGMDNSGNKLIGACSSVGTCPNSFADSPMLHHVKRDR